MLYTCSQCQFTAESDTNIELIIDHAYGHSPLSDFHLTREYATELRRFFYQNGYISSEFHSKVLEIVAMLDKYLGEK